MGITEISTTTSEGEAMTISPQLRKAGETIAKIGKEIEDSSIEDGDPPFRVTVRQLSTLVDSIEEVKKAMRHMTTEGEIEDQGEDIMEPMQ